MAFTIQRLVTLQQYLLSSRLLSISTKAGGPVFGPCPLSTIEQIIQSRAFAVLLIWGKQKMEMSDDEWKNFTEFAKSKSLELEDIYYLMNRKNRDEKIADSTRQEIHNKMREVQQQPGTLATQGSTPVEQSADDSVFDTILGSGNELEKAFSI